MRRHGRSVGTWINQAAIDAASKDGKLREALLAYGPNSEWKLDSQAGEATFSNGFELGEGTLSKSDDEHWKVAFYGDDNQESLELDGKELIQQASANGPEQRFRRLDPQPAANSPAEAAHEKRGYTNPGQDYQTAFGSDLFMPVRHTVTSGFYRVPLRFRAPLQYQ